MKVTAINALKTYFNEGEGKRPLPKFTQEIKALTPQERQELAQGVCAITGDELTVNLSKS